MAKNLARTSLRADARAKSDAAADQVVEPEMRVRIKAHATQLLIKHGYRGVSFGDIAAALATTRANIHYHFGSKTALVEEVLRAYVDTTLVQFRTIWTDPETSITEKVEATIAFNRQRYRLFNQGAINGKPWSMIARLRCDSDALNAPAVATLRRFATELTAMVTEGTRNAIQNKELLPNTPVDELVIQLVSIANSAGPVTQDAASFARLEELYRAFLHTVQAAYGRHQRR